MQNAFIPFKTTEKKTPWPTAYVYFSHNLTTGYTKTWIKMCGLKVNCLVAIEGG